MTQHIWLFDLDNTLHQADHTIFPLINQRMTKWIAQQLQLSHAQADMLRKQYWQQYGATLNGLRLHHPQLNIIDFLNFSHPLEQILPQIMAEQDLDTLCRLKGRKVIFSNGPSFYAQAVIHTLGLTNQFEAIFGIDDVDFLGKPHPKSYQKICQQLNTNPKNCIIVDDSLSNLQTAKTLGMISIWYGKHSHQIASVDAHIMQLSSLLKLENSLVQTASIR